MGVLTGQVLEGVALGGQVLQGVTLGAAGVPEASWRFAPASWQTDHRALLDGTYGSTYHAAWVGVGEGDYLYFTHDDGSGAQVGHDPGTTALELAGRTGHVVELPAGNVTAPDVAALAAPVLEAIAGVVEVVDNADGTIVVRGVDTLTTGGAFDDRSGGGVMGVPVAEILVADGGTGTLNSLYVSRFVVPSSPGTGPRLPRTVRVWVHSADLGDAPRVAIYRGDGTAPTMLYCDLGPIPVASVAGAGFVDLHVPVDFADTFAGGDYGYLAIKSTGAATAFRFMGSGSGYAGDFDGAFGLQATDGTMSGAAGVPFEATWSGGFGANFAVIWPAQIVWADLDAPVGDASLVRTWGTPRTTPMAAMLNSTALPYSLVHFIAPAPDVLGLVLAGAHIGLGTHTTTGTMRVAAWTGEASLLDPTDPHQPSGDGLVVVHDFGAEQELSPGAWYDFDAPELDVPIEAGQALAVSMHSDGVAGTTIRFELTGSGLAATLSDRAQAFDWYPSDGSGPGGSSSELEAYSSLTPQPPRVGAGNATVVTDPAVTPASPHQQSVNDVYQGNVAALGLTLRVRGMSSAA